MIQVDNTYSTMTEGSEKYKDLSIPELQLKKFDSAEINLDTLDIHAEIFSRGLIGGAKRISEYEFYHKFASGLASEDKDENEYTMKMLSHEIGGIQRSFVIVDHKDEPLFYVPSLMGFTFSVMPSEEDGGDTLGNATKDYREDQMYGSPALRHEFENLVLERGREALDFDESNRTNALMWYEILDYFGVLSEDESMDYDVVREDNKEHHNYIAWVRDVPLVDFILMNNQYERRDNGHLFKQKKEEIQPEQTGQNQGVLASESNDENEKFIDTDDWE